MQNPPSVKEAQDVISEQWSSVVGKAGRPPRVLRTVVFFSQEDGLEAFAVVDPGGRECFTLGTWDVETINWEADLARAVKNKVIGSQISVGGIQRIIVSLDGSSLPITQHGSTPRDYTTWLNVFTLQQEVTADWEQMLQDNSRLHERLLTRRSSLQAEAHKTRVFTELERHRPCLNERLQTQECLESALQELLDLCRSVGDTVTAQDLERATSASRLLKQQIERCLGEDTRLLQSLQDDHARLQQEIWRQTTFGTTGQGRLSLEAAGDTLNLNL